MENNFSTLMMEFPQAFRFQSLWLSNTGPQILGLFASIEASKLQTLSCDSQDLSDSFEFVKSIMIKCRSTLVTLYYSQEPYRPTESLQCSSSEFRYLFPKLFSFNFTGGEDHARYFSRFRYPSLFNLTLDTDAEIREEFWTGLP